MLAGVRVVEPAVWVAGPGASGILADARADLVKIEPPPRPGEHTAAVLRELGLPDAEFAALRASGAAR